MGSKSYATAVDAAFEPVNPWHAAATNNSGSRVI